ncbi:hypothetical protein IJ818_07170 [bacterium]|nr:hypothetical protein [bacterium]
MFTKEDILKKLNSDNYYIDLNALDTFIKEWQIDAIYENMEGVEFFDETSITKIKKGISLKSQGYNKEQISYRIHKALKDVEKEEQQSQQLSVNQEQNFVPEVRNVPLNMTSQAIDMLATAVSSKIAEDIKSHISNSEFAESLIEAGSYKKDNEILSQKVDELLNDNRKLAKRIEQLENDRRSFWKKLFG